MLYVEPESGVVVVTMGQTAGASTWNGGCDYDEGYTLTLMAEAWNDAIHVAHVAFHNGSSPPSAAGVDDPPTNRSNRDRGAVPARARARAPPARQQQHRQQAQAQAQAQAGLGAPTNATGSCTCPCPPGEGFGQCFDMGGGDSDCARASASAAFGSPRQHCPAAGIVKQCGLDTACLGGGHGWAGMDCAVVQSCPSTAQSPLDTMVCSCRPAAQARFSRCAYAPVPCSRLPR
jgi:hypothetical protein